jgi:uncharacterized protein YggU (UPF0235/DUF167 family)
MLIKVRVTTDAPAESIVKKTDDLYVVSVREPAELGMANGKVIQLLKDLNPGKIVRIVSGHHKSSKIIEIVE